ncbi:hypothetical protein QBC40DRAFT_212452 [Triangularia verruculosa]|uniref:SNF2 N-terminal domain-containing protein n=1 Tax=Triangularia verruculosa TaxID=2587418 RepID=A0AAN6X7C3_9PEZI|nr:hypothetical protein QBC40DRAFT_212452 [Triangularia verruculosa]
MANKRKVTESEVKESSKKNKQSNVPDADKKAAEASALAKKDCILADHVPLTQVGDMFHDMVSRAPPHPAQEAIKLRVATVCSGTDAPIFALEFLKQSVEMNGHDTPFEVQHLFSCEIEGYKQGFIRRNLPAPAIIFRDVIELAKVVSQPDGKALSAGGSKVLVPQEKIDFFFCGCSCVDYSNLNNTMTAANKLGNEKKLGVFKTLNRWLHQEKKEPPKVWPVKTNDEFVEALNHCLDDIDNPDLGESTRTFFSALIVINERRPKVIILENVDGAPWDTYIDRAFPLIGYKAAWLRVDSKKHYLPQTRQRGYLIAIDTESEGCGLKDASLAVKEWQTATRSLERYPSASIVSFLQLPDDIGTIMARADMEKDSATNNSDWGMSSLRHAAERQLYGLDADQNPFSHKTMRNLKVISPKFPPQAWHRWWAQQTCRVIDFMDIVEAAGNKSGIYLGHKTCVVDVSQNVDRAGPFTAKDETAHLKQNLGIIGCITPSGGPVVTDLMRPITGTEVMALQGMPVNEMVISTETQEQLRDLAGNAMTVTVVGAATYGALFAIHKHCPRLFESVSGPLAPRFSYYKKSQTASLLSGMDQSQLHPVIFEPETVHRLVGQMVRVCHCPPPILSDDEKSAGYVICQTCKTTLCKKCSGNPAHELEPWDINAAKFADQEHEHVSSEGGKVVLRNHLPQVLELQVSSTAFGDQSPAHEVLSAKTRYFLEGIKVTEVVTVTYKAPRTIARLVIRNDRKATWFVHFVPGCDLRSPSANPPTLPRTFEPSPPIARGDFEMSHEGVHHIKWSFWMPSQIELTTDFNKMTATTCGTAGNELHVSLDKDGNYQSNKTFILRHCTRTGPPNEDHLVWASEMRKLDYHELRDTYLQAPPQLKLTALPVGQTTKATVFSPGYWSDIEQDVDNRTLERVEPTTIHWGQTNDITAVAVQGNDDTNTTPSPPPVLAEIVTNVDAFPISAARRYMLGPQDNLDQFTIIRPNQTEDFLHDFAFAASAFRKQNLPDFGEAVTHFQNWTPIARCPQWSRPPPDIYVSDTQASKTNRYLPAEDPDEAKDFEETFLHLPRAITLASQLQSSTLSLLITLQPQVLASRAHTYLMQAHRTVPTGSMAVKNAEVYFRVHIDHARPRSLEFKKFFSLIKPCNDDHRDGIQWKEAYKNIQIITKRFKARGIQLRNSQHKAVLWMIIREKKPESFVETEIEEEVVAPLSVRVVGKATWPTKFPYSSRGGVAAHEIGYGKTVVTLSLIDYQYEFDRNQSMQERRQVDSCWEEEIKPEREKLKELGLPLAGMGKNKFFHHLSATLVLVPDHLTEQWSGEAKKFLGLEPKEIVIIRSLNQFYGGLTLEVLRRAELVIMSTKLLSDTFFDRLWGFGWGDRDHPFKNLSGRVRERWYREALRNIRILTASSLAGPGASEPGVQRELFGLRAAERSALLAKIVADSRRKDRRSPEEKVPASEGQAKKKEGRGEQAPVRRDWCASWLHNCSWARVVWDECSYDHRGDNKNIRFFVENLVAYTKWLLSGTPKAYDLAEVCNMAKVFGVHLARPEPRIMPGLPAVTAGPVLEPASKSEEFFEFSSALKSASLAHERHLQAEVFVRHFFRANRVDEDGDVKVSSVEVVLPVDMTALAAVRYHMAHQEALDADGDFSAMSAHVRLQPQYAGENLDDPIKSTKLLLSLLANDLTSPPRASTLAQLQDSLRASQHTMGRNVKFLFDKVMWLRDYLYFLCGVGHNEVETMKKRAGLKAQPGWAALKYICDEIDAAANRGVFGPHGGEWVFNCLAHTIIEGHPPANDDYTDNNGQLKQHFAGNWVDTYNNIKPHYTWLDFFDKGEIQIRPNTSKEVAKWLAVDLCRLRRRAGIDVPPPQMPTESQAERLFKSVRTMSSSLASPDPQNLGNEVVNDSMIIATWTLEQRLDFINAHLNLLNDRPTFDKKKNLPFDIGGLRVNLRTTKDQLIQKCHELNIKSAGSAEKLLQMLWEHSQGLGRGGVYRDGKAQDYKGGSFKKPEEYSTMLGLLKDTVVDLTKATDDFKNATRERTFIPKFIHYSSLPDKDQELRLRPCDGEHCGKPLPSARDSYIVVSCGHILCSLCRHTPTSRVCPAKSCSAFIKSRPVLPMTSLRADTHLTKADHLLSLLSSIIAKNEHVLVFAQYQSLLRSLWPRILALDPKATNMAHPPSRAEPSTLLEEFKKGNGGHVMLLDIDDDTSAGSNLTVANHVIFANPYFHHNKEHQARTVRQAKGRCIRYGQDKQVFVYHFMMLDTGEYEILREQQDENPAVKRFFDAGKENGEIVRELAGTYPALGALVENASGVFCPWWEEEKKYDVTSGGNLVVADTMTPPMSQAQQQMQEWMMEIDEDELYD